MSDQVLNVKMNDKHLSQVTKAECGVLKVITTTLVSIGDTLTRK